MIRRQDGQTAAEYVGMLLVVSVIIAAVASGGVGVHLGGVIDRQVCKVFGDCEGPQKQRDGAKAAPRAIARVARTPPPDPPLRPPVGEVDDYGGGLGELLFGRPYMVIDGRVVEVEENGLGGVVRVVGRVLGVGKKAWQAAKARARPLGIPTGMLLAAEKVARVRARQLTELLPQIERERFKTMAVGVGKAPDGSYRVIIGTNNPNGVLPAAVRAAIEEGEVVATRMGEGHAEVQILRWMEANRYQPVTVGAGRAICAQCADAIARAGATAASRLR